MTTSFVQGGCNLPTSCTGLCGFLDVGDLSCSPGGVADSLQWNWVIFGRAQVAWSPRFCVHIIQVQVVADSSSICSGSPLFFPNRKEEARRERKRNKQTNELVLVFMCN
jgi:hypothetical protein